MNSYATKTELVKAYAAKLELDGVSRFAAEMVSSDKAVYVPHLYRGGYVVRGFGFSMERVGKYVTVATMGNPATV